MTALTRPTSNVPLILRLVYDVLRVPAQALLAILSNRTKSRWFGSDVFERYTTYYTWITNQLGHWTIGTVLYVALWCVIYKIVPGDAVFWSALGVAILIWVIYVVKEVADVVRELEVPWRRFEIDLREVALDCWTDAFFVGFGIVVAHGIAWFISDSGTYWKYVWLLLIALGVLYVFERCSHYLPQKSRFDASDLPFYSRLARFNNALEGSLHEPNGETTPSDIVPRIERVASGADDSSHVCIFGPAGSGKTALAVGIACNLITGPRPVLYIAACDLDADDAKSDGLGHRTRQNAGLLTLDEARWIVVDHVSPSVADEVVREAARLRGKPVFIFTCDHEKEEDRDAFVQKLSRALHAPCLAVHLDGVLPRRGSRIAQADAAERAVRPIGTKSPTPA